MTSPVILISAGMLAPKKQDNPLSRLHLYLNYGMLALATIVAESGRAAVLLHGEFSDPVEFVRDMSARGYLETEFPILLSLPSSFALGWARAASAAIKSISPRARIVVGGRWVTAEDGVWIRRQIPGADLVVYGTADDRILAILNPDRWPTLAGTDLAGPLSGSRDRACARLDFRLLDRHEVYQPCVEVSRGCGQGCTFCAEAAVAMTKMKAPDLVASELHACQEAYDGGVIHPYFQASYFAPTDAWAESLRDQLAKQGVDVQWRAETRVDGLSRATVQNLAASGLKILDVGLESASPRQLLSMNKTRRPSDYLHKASSLLGWCRDAGVWVKVNVLLFPGETAATVRETEDWLGDHRDFIKGVSVGSTIVYRFGESSRAYLDELKVHGASAVNPAALDGEGYVRLNLSDEISEAAATETCIQLSRRLMSARDYFDLKSFSYFPRGFTWEMFTALQPPCGEKLPFSPITAPAS